MSEIAAIGSVRVNSPPFPPKTVFQLVMGAVSVSARALTAVVPYVALEPEAFIYHTSASVGSRFSLKSLIVTWTWPPIGTPALSVLTVARPSRSAS